MRLPAWCSALFVFSMLACHFSGSPERILVARSIVTMDPDRPFAQAVAIDSAGRIAAVGSLDEVRSQAPDLKIDRTLHQGEGIFRRQIQNSTRLTFSSKS